MFLDNFAERCSDTKRIVRKNADKKVEKSIKQSTEKKIHELN